jgi:7-cyano-7-deazaguanine synthase
MLLSIGLGWLSEEHSAQHFFKKEVAMSKAVVLLSGGQDSATCLAIAGKHYEEVYTISFNYGQRHKVELVRAEQLSKLARVKKHQVIDLTFLSTVSISALTETETSISAKHPMNHDLPASFVPGRNYLFLGVAGVIAYQVGAKDILIGTCETDYSGYPDCRRETILAIEKAVNLSLGTSLSKKRISILTPLMYLTKAQTVLKMQSLGKLDWYYYTHTCYEGKCPPCGDCPACKLRQKGFEKAGIIDPLLEG